MSKITGALLVFKILKALGLYFFKISFSWLIDVAILDVKLDKGDNDGIELLSHIKSINKDVPVIVITGHANIEMAVNSLKKGAFEFVEKPFDRNRLLNFISRAVENLNLKNQNKEFEIKLFSS